MISQQTQILRTEAEWPKWNATFIDAPFAGCEVEGLGSKNGAFTWCNPLLGFYGSSQEEPRPSASLLTLNIGSRWPPTLGEGCDQRLRFGAYLSSHNQA
jgi:hypothetical protein